MSDNHSQIKIGDGSGLAGNRAQFDLMLGLRVLQ